MNKIFELVSIEQRGAKPVARMFPLVLTRKHHVFRCNLVDNTRTSLKHISGMRLN